MNNLKGLWLKNAGKLEEKEIDKESSRSAAVVITGIELLPNNTSGMTPKICYALCLLHNGIELAARRLDTSKVEEWLSRGASLVREAFEYAKLEDGVSSKFLGYAAEYERLYEYSEVQAGRLAIPNRLRL